LYLDTNLNTAGSITANGAIVGESTITAAGPINADGGLSSTNVAVSGPVSAFSLAVSGNIAASGTVTITNSSNSFLIKSGAGSMNGAGGACAGVGCGGSTTPRPYGSFSVNGNEVMRIDSFGIIWVSTAFPEVVSTTFSRSAESMLGRVRRLDLGDINGTRSLRQLFPEAIMTDKEFRGVSTTHLGMFALKGVQELATQNVEQRLQFQALQLQTEQTQTKLAAQQLEIQALQAQLHELTALLRVK
jgi:hypothetical protein